MTVKEFLLNFSSIMAMNSFFNSNVPKTLIVDIKQNNLFHAVGYFNKTDLDIHPELTIIRPFERTLYQKSKEISCFVLDMKVRTWKLVESSNSELALCIETQDIN